MNGLKKVIDIVVILALAIITGLMAFGGIGGYEGWWMTAVFLVIVIKFFF